MGRNKCIGLTEDQKQYVRENAINMSVLSLSKALPGANQHLIYRFIHEEKIPVKLIRNKIKVSRDDGFFDYDRMYL